MPRADDDFTASVRPHLPCLRRAAQRLTRNASDADDLVQDTLLRAFRFFARYERGTHLRAWLLRIQRNAFMSRMRAETRTRALRVRMWAEQPTHAEPEADARAREQLDPALAARLSALPEIYRAVLVTVAVQEASYREAAERLGCPIGTVMSRLHRARRALLAAA
jgi:RNA polymerase sigma-70 factor (ECF subfamily)